MSEHILVSCPSLSLTQPVCYTVPPVIITVYTGFPRLESPAFLPARRYARAGLSDSNVSVCHSRYCIKTETASVTISSPYDSPFI